MKAKELAQLLELVVRKVVKEELKPILKEIKQSSKPIIKERAVTKPTASESTGATKRRGRPPKAAVVAAPPAEVKTEVENVVETPNSEVSSEA